MITCPDCKAPTKVLETRSKKNCQTRRRECVNCKTRFNTREYSLDDLIKLKEEYLSLQEEVKRLKLAHKMLRFDNRNFEL
tara:strand:- start:666 stop:905 length:240 start_codon:yes stop_codon:yes gene_type:complete